MKYSQKGQLFGVYVRELNESSGDSLWMSKLGAESSTK